jgi:ankyrin repeat protein
MIRLLIRHGAALEEVAEDSNPVLDAVKFSRFLGAEELLKAGCNPDFVDSKGHTALHVMLKKGTPPEYFEMFVAAGARGDIPDKHGKTAIDILRRKRDPVWQKIADRLKAAA